MSSRPADTAKRTVNDIEGYLLWEAEKSEAAARAREFVLRVPWLDGVAREEVRRLYTEDQLTVSKLYLTRVAERSAALRREYQARYELLRRRLVGAVLASLSVALVAVELCPRPWG